MNAYNSAFTTPRPVKKYTFFSKARLLDPNGKLRSLPLLEAKLRPGLRLGGYAHEYSSLGKGAQAVCNTQAETVQVGSDGVLSIGVKDSQAVVLTLLK